MKSSTGSKFNFLVKNYIDLFPVRLNRFGLILPWLYVKPPPTEAFPTTDDRSWGTWSPAPSRLRVGASRKDFCKTNDKKKRNKTQQF